MKLHAADAAFLDGLHWIVGSCVMGKPGHQVGRVVEVDHIEQGSGTGFPVYSCRTCLAYRLTLDRAAAADANQDAAYEPSLQRTAGPEAIARRTTAGRATGSRGGDDERLPVALGRRGPAGLAVARDVGVEVNQS